MLKRILALPFAMVGLLCLAVGLVIRFGADACDRMIDGIINVIKGEA